MGRVLASPDTPTGSPRRPPVLPPDLFPIPWPPPPLRAKPRARRREEILAPPGSALSLGEFVHLGRLCLLLCHRELITDLLYGVVRKIK